MCIIVYGFVPCLSRCYMHVYDFVLYFRSGNHADCHRTMRAPAEQDDRSVRCTASRREMKIAPLLMKTLVSFHVSCSFDYYGSNQPGTDPGSHKNGVGAHCQKGRVGGWGGGTLPKNKRGEHKTEMAMHAHIYRHVIVAFVQQGRIIVTFFIFYFLFFIFYI